MGNSSYGTGFGQVYDGIWTLRVCLHPKFTSAGRIEDEALVSPYSPLIIRKTELESPKVLGRVISGIINETQRDTLGMLAERV